ncbi:MAG: hypothetical protein HDT43_11320 [Ruminococcaceae bacterium]|nr:hypothetical protein [Oscillospiraceae bacterium]
MRIEFSKSAQKEQNLISEMIKRVVLAWDPDFTKVTPQELKRIEQAEAEFERGETVSADDINWD